MCQNHIDRTLARAGKKKNPTININYNAPNNDQQQEKLSKLLQLFEQHFEGTQDDQPILYESITDSITTKLNALKLD